MKNQKNVTEDFKTMENKITIDRVVLAFAFSAMMFMYSELDKKLDKVEYNRNRTETKQVLQRITDNQEKTLQSITELKTIVRLKYGVKLNQNVK